MAEALISRSSSGSDSSTSGGILKTEIILENTNWKAPIAKNQTFRVILFGGGESGYQSGRGGNGGFMNFNNFTIAANTLVAVTIGRGGIPSNNTNVSNKYYNQNGGTSSFGSYMTAAGGSTIGGGSGGGGYGGDGSAGTLFGGGGAGGNEYGGNGGTYGGGGGGGNYANYYGRGGTYGGNGGSWKNSTSYTAPDNGKDFNRSGSFILLEENNFGIGLHGYGSACGGGGYGGRGGDTFNRIAGSGGGGGYGLEARGGDGGQVSNAGGGGGGFHARGGHGRNGGGGGGGCGAFGLHGNGGDGWSKSTVGMYTGTTVDTYVETDIYSGGVDGGIAAGGGGGNGNGGNYNFGEVVNQEYRSSRPGNGGNGVCIIQYYI